jgi:hypothetical protein
MHVAPSHAGPPTRLLVRCRNPSELTAWYTNQPSRLTGTCKLPLLHTAYCIGLAHHCQRRRLTTSLWRGIRATAGDGTCELLCVHPSPRGVLWREQVPARWVASSTRDPWGWRMREVDVGAWPAKHVAGFVADEGRNLGVG